MISVAIRYKVKREFNIKKYIISLILAFSYYTINTLQQMVGVDVSELISDAPNLCITAVFKVNKGYKYAFP